MSQLGNKILPFSSSFIGVLDLLVGVKYLILIGIFKISISTVCRIIDVL